jgi:hypothetical protein
MTDSNQAGRVLDDLAGLTRIRSKPKPEEPKKEFPARALRYREGQAPLIPDGPDAVDR